MTILSPDKEILDEIQQILAKLVDVDYKDETKFREIEDFDKEIQEIIKWDEGIAYGSCYSHIGAYRIEQGRVTELILFSITDFDEFDEDSPEKAEYFKQAFHIIDDRIGELQEIKKLAIMYCGLRKVPPCINNFPKLEVLNLRHNHIKQFDFSNLPKLYILNLEHNPVKEYTGTIGFQDKLRELYLTSNHSKELPPEIVNLTNLEILKLKSSFYLSSLPVGFGNLSNLKLLDLSFCDGLKSITSEIGLLRNLTTLNLRKISLTELPIEIGNLENLRTLNLSSNKLISFPVQICSLRKLENLDLRNNIIPTLPSEIEQLKELKELRLVETHLNSIPPEIGELTNLEVLHLSYNNLENLPDELVKLKSLKVFRASNNNLKNIPQEILDLCNSNKNEISDMVKKRLKERENEK